MFKFKNKKEIKNDFQEDYLNLESEFLKLKAENEKLKQEIENNDLLFSSLVTIIKFIKKV